MKSSKVTSASGPGRMSLYPAPSSCPNGYHPLGTYDSANGETPFQLCPSISSPRTDNLSAGTLFDAKIGTIPRPIREANTRPGSPRSPVTITARNRAATSRIDFATATARRITSRSHQQPPLTLTFASSMMRMETVFRMRASRSFRAGPSS